MHTELPVEVGHLCLEVMDSHPHISHSEHRLSFLVRGRLRMEHGDRLEITPGMVTLVPAGVPHRLLGGVDMEVWWVGFCAACMRLDEAHPLMDSFQRVRLGALPVSLLATERQQYFVMLIQELAEEIRLSRPESHEVIRSLLLLLLREVKRASPLDVEPIQDRGLLSEALTYIQMHSLEPISLRDVAEAVHRSPSYLATVVKKGTGYSVGEWISRSRLSEACSRLVHTDDRVDAIAHWVGWSDVTHFIRQFKKAYGVTPAVWRKENKRGGRMETC